MKKCCFAGWIGVLGVFLLPVLAFAGGFAINEQGTKASGMANAYSAQADDPTAVYYNPAGIVQLDGTQISVGASPIIPMATFESSTPAASAPYPEIRGTERGQETDLEDNVITVPNAYITQKISDRASLGFGVFSNFGLQTDWPNDWEGRFIVGGTNAELVTISLNPVVAFRPHQRVSVACGPVIQYLDFELKQKQFTGAPPSPELNSKFTGDNWDYGWNAGFLFWLTENIKVGASYRSEVRHNINGKLKFSPELGTFTDTGISSTIKMPANAYLGLAWTYGPLTLEFDAQWTDWSSYGKLAADFDDPVGPTAATGLTVEEDWHDSWAYRFGAQFAVNQYLDVRAGIAYDESPIPRKSVGPRIPGSDRWIYAVGFGGHFKGFDADLAYNYVDAESIKLGRTAGEDDVFDAGAAPGPLTGKFKDVDAHIVSFNLTYRF